MTPIRRPRKPEPAATSRRRPAETQRTSAFSYHASRSSREANVGRELTRDTPERPRIPKKYVLIGVAVIVVIILGSIQTTTSHIKVLGTQQSRELLQSATVYQSAANALLSSSFSNHLKFTTDNATIEQSLKNQFPELAAVTVSQSLFTNYSTVTVEAVRPALQVAGNGGTFVIDEQGSARLAASQVSESTRASLPMVEDQSGLTLATGKAALPSGDVAFIEQVLAQLKQADVSWQQLTLPAGTSELDVKITDQPYFVKFALRGGADARQQAGTYLAARDQIRPTQYVDVRVPERLYYK